MVKGFVGVIVLSILTLFGPTQSKTGCQRAVGTVTNVTYPQHRDMRNSVALLSQRGWYRGPDSSSVPVSGHDVLGDIVKFDASYRVPTASSAEAVASGEKTYARVCTPCHGPSLDGNGPVWLSKKYMMPPANLMAATTRARTDGYIYRYIRFGGAVMPPYGAQVTAEQAWNLIHYIRSMQEKTPQ